MCSREAFSSQHEIYNILNGNMQKMPIQSDPGYEELPRCFNLHPGSSVIAQDQACICSRQVWILWFPCSLKYCRNRDGEGEHRCGIKSCQKCLTFRYKAKSKLHCSWDEPWNQRFLALFEKKWLFLFVKRKSSLFQLLWYLQNIVFKWKIHSAKLIMY